jgi:hypothetical protein
MAIPVKHRWYIYVVALALTVLAVRWAGGQDRAPAAAVAEPAPREARADQAASPIPGLDLDKLAKRIRPTANGDPFQARSWEQMASTQTRRAAPPPPPPPQAPPLPFAYMGRLIDDGAVTVFLTKQDRNYIVRAGETLDGAYNVERIEEERLVLTYLPLGIQQTLSFEANAPQAVGLPQTPQAVGLPQAPPRQPLPPRGRQRDDEEED